MADNQYHIEGLDEAEFSAFVDEIERYALDTRERFERWTAQFSERRVVLDKDPTANLMGFYDKLEEAQTLKSDLVDVLTDALVTKAQWESFLNRAEGYVMKARASLKPLVDLKENKSKEMQDAAIYRMRPDVFACLHGCEMMCDWVKTRYSALDARLDLAESANLNINRQITVTELLSYKGLL